MDNRLFFPKPLRNFPGARWVRIGLRTWHLIAMGYVLGGVALGTPFADLAGPLWATLVSGLLFVGVELYTSCIFLLQLKGWAVLAKVLLLGAAVAAPAHAEAYLVVAVIIGGISSHMPGRFRYYSVVHGAVRKE